MEYNQDLKNKEIEISEDLLVLFNNLNKELTLQELLEDRNTLHRVELDYIFGSVKDEGNTYTISGLQTLVERNIVSPNNTFEESLMIMNIKRSIDYIVEDFSHPITKKLVCELHTIISSGLVHPNDVGNIRNRPVYITGTSYIPPSGESFISSELEELLKIASKINNPFEKAIYLNINLCYLQAFTDINKRVARTIQVYSMLQNGVVPLFVNGESIDGFRDSMKVYYETGNYSAYSEWFTNAYLAMFSKLLGRIIKPSSNNVKRSNLFGDN